MRSRPRWTARRVVALVVMLLAPALTSLAVGQPSEAAPPPSGPFDIQCAGTTQNSVAGLTRVDGARLTKYNAGDIVPLYDGFGFRQAFAIPPVCGVRYDPAAGGPVAEWMFCTDLGPDSCGYMDDAGNITDELGNVRGPLSPLTDNPRLNPDQERIIAYLIRNGHTFQGAPGFGFGGATRAVADGNSFERAALQHLIQCISDNLPAPTCDLNLPPSEQAAILARVTAAAPLLTISTPGVSQLVGATVRVALTTNIYDQPVSLSVPPGATIALCPGTAGASFDTQTQLLRVNPPSGGAPSRVIELCVTGTVAGSISLTANASPTSLAQIRWNQSASTGEPCQVYATFDSQAPVQVRSSTQIAFRAALSTSAADQADGDRVLPAAGGVIVDTVSYSGLIPGTQYVVRGTLVDKSTGKPVSPAVTASSAPFTPAAASGKISVAFRVPRGLAGRSLVVFETLYDTHGTPATGDDTEVAHHSDVNDAQQTVTVKQRKPKLSTSAVDKADRDRVLPASGGVIVDKVIYTGLTAGTQYVVRGILVDKATGKPVSPRVTASSAPFTPAAATGMVSVQFRVPGGLAGKSLVVFETLFDTHRTPAAGDDTEVAHHRDVDDAQQTVTVRRRGVAGNHGQLPNTGMR